MLVSSKEYTLVHRQATAIEPEGGAGLTVRSCKLYTNLNTPLAQRPAEDLSSLKSMYPLLPIAENTLQFASLSRISQKHVWGHALCPTVSSARKSSHLPTLLRTVSGRMRPDKFAWCGRYSSRLQRSAVKAFNARNYCTKKCDVQKKCLCLYQSLGHGDSHFITRALCSLNRTFYPVVNMFESPSQLLSGGHVW